MIYKKVAVSLLIVLIAGLLWFKGTEKKVLSVAVQQELIPVLMYHRVSPYLYRGGPGLRVNSDAFRRQMKYLHDHGYHTISLDQLMDHWQKNLPLPARPIVITFDDGYEDNYLYAFPVLREHGFTATIFLVYDKVGSYNTWDAKDNIVQRIDLLNWRQINIMKKYGISFQSHTLTHPDLTNVKPERARLEILESKKKLEKKLGVQVNFFAYPYGRTNPLIEETVRQAGFRGAVTTVPGKNSASTNPVELKRLRVNGHTTMKAFANMLEN